MAPTTRTFLALSPRRTPLAPFSQTKANVCDSMFRFFVPSILSDSFLLFYGDAEPLARWNPPPQPFNNEEGTTTTPNGV